jgi:hypothetical protein
MKNAFGIVVLCLAVSPIGIFAKDQAATDTPSTYTRPEKAVKPDAQAIAALLAAKTVAIVGIDAAVLEITSIDREKHTITAVKRGGIRRGVDAEKARKSVEEMVTDWGRFTAVASPAEADLVLVVFEDSVPPSGFSKGTGDAKYRLRDILAVFRGGEPSPAAQPLWADVSTESTFGALTGSSAGKVAKKLRDDVEKLSSKK